MPLLLPIIAVAAAVVGPAEQLRYDTRGRPVIGVYIDGRGPFDMVVDTAAETSLITEDLARALKLPPAAETLDVIGATGTAEARVYKVKRFNNALFDKRDGTLVALPNAGSTTARGIIGMDLLADRRLVFDRTTGSLAAEPSVPPPPRFVAVRGRTTPARSLIVSVSMNGVPVQALVDTGAAVTLASPAALRAMAWADDDPRLKAGGTITGATASGQTVRVAAIDRLAIGPATLSNVQMVFPGEAAFADRDAASAPMLVLGMDILGKLDAFAIDLRRGELQIRVPAAPVVPAR